MRKLRDYGVDNLSEKSNKALKKKKVLSISDLKRRASILQGIGKVKDDKYLTDRILNTKRASP